MPALWKFLVLLAIFLSASHVNAFTSLSWVTGNQVWVNHLIRFQQQLSDPTNEPSREPICKPTKRMDSTYKISTDSNFSQYFSSIHQRNETCSTFRMVACEHLCLKFDKTCSAFQMVVCEHQCLKFDVLLVVCEHQSLNNTFKLVVASVEVALAFNNISKVDEFKLIITSMFG